MSEFYILYSFTEINVQKEFFNNIEKHLKDYPVLAHWSNFIENYRETFIIVPEDSVKSIIHVFKKNEAGMLTHMKVDSKDFK